MMPFLMRGRNESIILHDMVLDLSCTLPFLARYNADKSHGERASLVPLFLWACARTLHDRPGLNRFVSGGRIYQRHDVSIAFAAKRAMHDDASFVTVKLVFPRDEPFEACVHRIRSFIREGRSGRPRAVDAGKSTSPRGCRLRCSAPEWRLLRKLHAVNLVPKRMIDSDPMYASIFVANLGAVGVDDVAHHLYEYGT